MAHTMEELRSAWNTRFSGADWADGIRMQAMRGSLATFPLRSICWQVFLGLLPPDTSQWETTLTSRRGSYELLRRRYLTDPTSEAPAQADLDLNNPLSQEVDSPWQRYFQDTELKKEIVLDVERTIPEVAFFQLKRTQHLLLNILFVYAKEHPALGYRQGMHELLAPLLMVRADPRIDPKTEPCPDCPLLGLALDSSFVEHDTYAMFEKVMATTGPWFEATKEPPRTPNPLIDAPFMDLRPPPPNNAVVRKVTRIQNELLKRADPELYKNLARHEITPQTYGMRMVRLLFGREMELSQLLVLWDCVFADSSDLDLVDYVAVALLVAVRDRLLAQDSSEVLMALMRYPGVTNVVGLVDRAIAIRRRCTATEPTPISSPSLSEASQSTVQATPSPSAPVTKAAAAITAKVEGAVKFLADSVVRPKIQTPSSNQDMGMPSELADTCASLLEDCVAVLETELARLQQEDEPSVLGHNALSTIRHVVDMLYQRRVLPHRPSQSVPHIPHTPIPEAPRQKQQEEDTAPSEQSEFSWQEDASSPSTPPPTTTTTATPPPPTPGQSLASFTTPSDQLPPPSPATSSLDDISLGGTPRPVQKPATKARVKKNLLEDEDHPSDEDSLFGARKKATLLNSLLQ
eukprot:comp19375_c0_seq1/m.22335 comp19375_c0_seq1/g.22335  ORF comp19375_c0_seq1/g.22335 comp19375_c0_seq1/m.22335 type:complete len:632 (-) comp19375_c0_seq1:725-2620(-)